MLSRLNQVDLSDEMARKYLGELQARFDPLEYSIEHTVWLVQLAFDLGLPCEFCRWVSLASSLGFSIDVAEDAIREIQSLVITWQSIEGLADYAQEVESRSRWGVNA